MGITLQDMEVMLGIPVDRLPVTGRTDMQWNVVCQELLGHEPPLMIPNSNKSTLTGARIKYKWLDAMFAAPPATDAGDEVVQQHARYHLLVRMGALLLMDKSADQVSLLPLQLITQLAMLDGTAGAVQHWLGSTGNFVVHRRRMRCRLEEHSCWCSYGPIQGSHEYALLRGRLYRQCTQGPLPLGTFIDFSLFKLSVS
ncbi:hypothetical protein SO802_015061 [Lithocarpus litseifolius]|uniref:Aminotransferase-like plant mobile domain-containing protein n=1 Tax=Lithocarpus litseifolius TaxID=425828 RepID=A0AAW2CVX5_9ROSI